QGVVNNTIQFYGLATVGTPPYTYHWEFGDGETSEEQNPTHVYHTYGEYTVTLTVSDSKGKTAEDSVTVTVNPQNTLTVDAGGPYTGMVNTAMWFSATTTGGTPPYTYHWEFGDGETSEEQNPTHVYQSAGEYTVTLTVTDGEQNTDESRTQVVVIEQPPAGVEIKEIKGFLGVKATINNAETTPVEWEINITGGFILFGGHAAGTIPAETETTVSSGLIIGFGKINVEICAGNVCKEAEGLLFGPVVLNLKET
ncbi:MAG TPA: PKD domain-containing protein, partial [Thermoplasmatales archaeon]|nr:PKD domain-containing protein [Thermoplasmatales archaeon]